METKYYTPSINEFKQGFKFELLIRKKGDKDTGRVILGNPDATIWYENKEDVWVEQEVWWDRPSEMRTFKYGDITITYKENKFDLQPNYDLNKYLENGKIRVKQ
jgi:hypothetical protein